MAQFAKTGQFFDVAIRCYVGSLLAAPFAYFFTMRMLWDKSYWEMLNWSLSMMFGWSIALWLGAILIGFPAALVVVSQTVGFWKRTGILVAAGSLSIFALSLLIFGPIAIFSFPASAVTALFCCLLNYRRLKMDQFVFLGKLRGVGIGE